MTFRHWLNISRNISVDIDYHRISTYFIKTQSALDNMDINLKALYDWLRMQVEEVYRASILKSERQVTS